MPIPQPIEEIALRVRELSENLRGFLNSADVTEAIIELQRIYMLDDATAITLSRLVGWYVIGLLNAHELAEELARIAPQGKLANFRSDVIKKIFMPFSAELHASGLNFETIIAPSTTVTATKPVPAPTSTVPPVSTPTPVVVSPKPTAPAQPIPQPPTPIAPKPPAPAEPGPERAAPATQAAPTMQAAPTTQAAPRPVSGAPRIIVSAIGTPTPPSAPTEKAPTAPALPEAKPAAPFQPIRYTPAQKPPEVPKVISVPKPLDSAQSMPPTQQELPKEEKGKSSGGVIDLSTFSVEPSKNPSATQNSEPKGMGNVIDLKPKPARPNGV